MPKELYKIDMRDDCSYKVLASSIERAIERARRQHAEDCSDDGAVSSAMCEAEVFLDEDD